MPTQFHTCKSCNDGPCDGSCFACRQLEYGKAAMYETTFPPPPYAPRDGIVNLHTDWPPEPPPPDRNAAGEMIANNPELLQLKFYTIYKNPDWKDPPELVEARRQVAEWNEFLKNVDLNAGPIPMDVWAEVSGSKAWLIGTSEKMCDSRLHPSKTDSFGPIDKYKARGYNREANTETSWLIKDVGPPTIANLYKFVRHAWLHELREWFVVGGKTPLHPHEHPIVETMDDPDGFGPDGHFTRMSKGKP